MSRPSNSEIPTFITDIYSPEQLVEDIDIRDIAACLGFLEEGFRCVAGYAGGGKEAGTKVDMVAREAINEAAGRISLGEQYFAGPHPYIEPGQGIGIGIWTAKQQNS